MLLARSAWGPSAGPVLLVVSPTDSPLMAAIVVAGLALVVLIMIADAPQQQPPGNFEKQSL